MPSQVLEKGSRMMTNFLKDFAASLWIVLGIQTFFMLKKWNKRFSDLYDELYAEVRRSIGQ